MDSITLPVCHVRFLPQTAVQTVGFPKKKRPVTPRSWKTTPIMVTSWRILATVAGFRVLLPVLCPKTSHGKGRQVKAKPTVQLDGKVGSDLVRWTVSAWKFRSKNESLRGLLWSQTTLWYWDFYVVSYWMRSYAIGSTESWKSQGRKFGGVLDLDQGFG